MTTRITNSMIDRIALSDIQNAAARLSKTQQELSSGKQLTTPSDDPYGTVRALDLRTSLAQNAQFQKNVQDAQSWHDVTDTALGNVNDFVLRARDLLVRGSNDSQGQEARDAAADEIDQIVDGIKSEANTQYAGRYIFSGTATQTKPYQVGGADTYSGNTGTIDRAISTGVTLQVNTVGSNVFGDGTSGLIKNLRDIASDLRSGNTAALQGTDLKNLDADTDSLLAVRAQVGARSNRLTAAQTRLEQIDQTQTQLKSDIEDADMAKTITDYSMQSAVYQAALKSGADIIKPSLMDFLTT